MESHLAPVAVSGGRTFTSLVAGSYHTCGLVSGGTAFCWGMNMFGQLGDGSLDSRMAPVAVSGGRTFTSLVAGSNHTCGLVAGGTAHCWGSNWFGQLGDGTSAADGGSSSNRTFPVAVSAGLTFLSLVAGNSHTCGLDSGGTAYCWGYNGNGQLGDGTTDWPPTSPVPVSGGRVFTSLVAGFSHSCGLDPGGTAYCWGGNWNGPLGDGTTDQHSSPVAVDVSAIPVPTPVPSTRSVRIANIRDTSFTVSWTTSSPTTGSVRWGPAGTSSAPATLASDRRGPATSSTVHIVTVSGLLPHSSYRFDLVSGDATDTNAGAHFAVSTGPTLPLASPYPVHGAVSRRDGGLPAAALVHVFASGPSGTSSSLSTIISPSDAGAWVVDLSNLRTAAGDARYPVSDTTVLTVVADAGADGNATGTVSVAGARSGSLALRLDNEFRFALDAGWNLVTLVATPADRLFAKGVCHSLDEVTPGSAVEVYRWENGGWDGHVCGLPVNDFALEVGRGYFVRLSLPSQWAYQGMAESVPATLSLVTGWNLVGPAVVSPLPSTASGSCASFADASGSGSALELARWVDGGWDTYLCGLPPNDFTLEAGRGYFVRLSRPTQWTPVGSAPTNAVTSFSVRRTAPVTTQVSTPVSNPVATPAPGSPPARITPPGLVGRPDLVGRPGLVGRPDLLGRP